jgi:hypothetical protein
LVLACAVVASQAVADGLSFDPLFTQGDFESLTKAMGDTVAFPCLEPANASGITGFELLVAGGGVLADSGSHWWKHGVDSSTVGGLMTGGRVIGRKGLPERFDLGVQYGYVAGEQFWGAEARWALLAGGSLEPAVALRATYSRLESDAADFVVSEGQIMLSKGFTVITPYLMGGYRRVVGTPATVASGPQLHSVTADGLVGAAGIRVGLPPFRFVAEARQGEDLGFFVGVGVGL